MTADGFDRLRRRNLLQMARTRCKHTGRECTLTIADVDSLWPSDGRCPVFPWITLAWGEYESGCSPSIDRVDTSKGYTPENCRVISWRANRLKSDATPEELVLLLAYTSQQS